MNGNTFYYDAENRPFLAVAPASTGGYNESLVYDGLGQRVKKLGDSGATVYVYDAFGQLAAEYSSTTTRTAPCGTCYLSYDHLGSVRMVTDGSGAVVGRHDFLPFGEEIASGTAGRGSQFGASDSVNQQFTGQARDGELGIDYFQARYYGAALGRFTGPDPAHAGADLLHPQSWNGYAYVSNSPLVFTDPTGLFRWSDVGSFFSHAWSGVSGWFGFGTLHGYQITSGLVDEPSTTVSGRFGREPGASATGGSAGPGWSSSSGVRFTATGLGKDDVPTVSTPPTQQLQPANTGPYKTLNCAGYKAVQSIFPQTKAQIREFGGFIDKNPNGTYSYSNPFAGSRSSLPSFYDQYSNHMQSLSKGYSVAGWYHSHPVPPPTYPSAEAFSGQDLSVSHYIGAPGFVITPGRMVLRLDSGPPATTTRVPPSVCQ